LDENLGLNTNQDGPQKEKLKNNSVHILNAEVKINHNNSRSKSIPYFFLVEGYVLYNPRFSLCPLGRSVCFFLLSLYQLFCLSYSFLFPEGDVCQGHYEGFDSPGKSFDAEGSALYHPQSEVVF